MMQLLHERSQTVFYDPIATDNYHFQRCRIEQLKKELKDAKRQKATAKVQQKPLLAGDSKR